MVVRRIDWSTAAQGARVVPCLLIAGYPYPIVPCGVTLATVAWTASSDNAWHAGTSSLTSKPWIALPLDDDENPPPGIVIDEKATPTRSQIEMGSVTIVLEDVDGEVTDLLGARDLLPSARLSATLETAGSSITLETTGPFDALSLPFVVHVGREAISVASRVSGTPGTLGTLTHGMYGTLARRHVVSSRLPAPVCYGPAPAGTSFALPSLKGRRATLWLLRMDGTTATDPELIFDGRIGPGITPHGPGWSIPIDHVLKVLDAKLEEQQLAVWGWAHPTVPPSAKAMDIMTSGGVVVALDDTSNNGWHSSALEVAIALRVLAATLAPGELSISIEEGTWTIEGASGAPTVSTIWTPTGRGLVGNVVTVEGSPGVFAWLGGRVHLMPWDMPKVPAVPTGLAAGTNVYWVLEAPAAEGESEPRRGRITALASTYVEVTPMVRPLLEMMLTGADPIPLTLRLRIESTSWVDAVENGLLVVLADHLGLDHVSDSIDWVTLRDTARRYPGAFQSARGYYVPAEGTLLDLLQREAKINGLAIVPRRGRLAMVRIAEVAPTEPVAATITTQDLLAGEPPMGSEVSDGVVTSYLVKLPSGSEVLVQDMSAEDESGDGDPFEVELLDGILRETQVLDSRVHDALLDQATHVLGPWRRAYWLVTVQVSLLYAHVQVGEVVVLSEWLMPTRSGTRGLSNATCLVLARRLFVTSGYVELDLRVCDISLAGYTAEACVASISGTTVTIDATYHADHGFADDLLSTGADRVDGGTDTFVAGDEVQILQMDSTTPAAPFTTHVHTVDAATRTIELHAAPGAAWEALATTPGKVWIAYDTPGTTSQKRYCYIASYTTLLISAALGARRWAP